MDAERAARRIVRAMEQGKRHVVLGVPAKAAFYAHGLFPGATDALLGGANHLLPLAKKLPVPKFLTRLGDAAARRFQYGASGADS
jgi:hypothetical protein